MIQVELRSICSLTALNYKRYDTILLFSANNIFDNYAFSTSVPLITVLLIDIPTSRDGRPAIGDGFGVNF